MTPTDRDAGHCGGPDCFQGAEPVDCCLCDCDGCVEAVAAEMVEQARAEQGRGAAPPQKTKGPPR